MQSTCAPHLVCVHLCNGTKCFTVVYLLQPQAKPSQHPILKDHHFLLKNLEVSTTKFSLLFFFSPLSFNIGSRANHDSESPSTKKKNEKYQRPRYTCSTPTWQSAGDVTSLSPPLFFLRPSKSSARINHSFPRLISSPLLPPASPTKAAPRIPPPCPPRSTRSPPSPLAASAVGGGGGGGPPRRYGRRAPWGRRRWRCP